jgi:hypothetical protein
MGLLYPRISAALCKPEMTRQYFVLWVGTVVEKEEWGSGYEDIVANKDNFQKICSRVMLYG